MSEAMQTRFLLFMSAVDDDLLEEALLAPSHRSKALWRRVAIAACLALALLVGAVNLSPTVASALESIPVVGELIRLIDYRTYIHVDEQGHGLTLTQPVAEGDKVDDLNRAIEEEVALLRARFDTAAENAGMGHADQDTSYEILRNDEDLFTLRFSTTQNLGSSWTFSRCLTLDRETGKVLALSDLFAPGADYITPISENLIEQMTQRRDAGEGDYFVPGGIWSDEECFKTLDPAQNFYLNGENRLVIVFDEYQVSAGSGGMPEFVIPPETLAGILAEDSPLAAN